jgi:hypothetical protein
MAYNKTMAEIKNPFDMPDGWQLVEIKPAQRNDYDSKSTNLHVTLPKNTYEYIVSWAHSRNISVSRAVHLHIWYGYHALKGDFKPPINPAGEAGGGQNTGHFVERLNELTDE